MNKILRFITFLCAISLIVCIPVNNALADGPTPVGTPAVVKEDTSATGITHPQGFPSKKEIQIQVSAPQGSPSKSRKPLNALAGTVTVSSAWTTDGNGNAKSVFNANDSIRYYGNVYNATGQTVNAYFLWSRSGPCSSATMWSGNLGTGAGTWTWNLPTAVPSGCSGTYTYTLSVTYNGQTTSKSSTVTVNGGGGGVTVSSAWTTDGNGNAKSTFNANDSIRYYGNINNTTGKTVNAYFLWSRSGPCSSATMWSGNLATGAGTWTWNLATAVPSGCSGTYTYTLSVTYNGQTTSKSSTVTVNGGGGGVTVSSAWTTDGNGNAKTAFNANDSIRYYGNINNTTGKTVNAYFVWSRSGPCNSATMWSGNLDTGAGTWTWNLATAVPIGCSGTYTYTLSVTYNGQTTSKSSTVTLNASGIRGIDYHMNSDFHVFKIDMQSPNLSFETVMADDSTNVNRVPSPRESVSAMVSRSPYSSRNPVLAFNADYFARDKTHGPEGLTVKKGSRFDGYGADLDDKDGNEWWRSSFSITSSKGLRMGRQTDCTSACLNWVPNSSSYYNTVGGGPLFVDNKQRIGGSKSVLPCTNEEFKNAEGLAYCTGEFKWTAVGMTQDGRYLIVVISDKNKTMDQAASVLIAEGAWRAMKLDGGSSTQVWYKEKGSIITGNAVANAIVVFSTP